MSTPRSTTTTALTIAGAAVFGGIVAYAVYFDYKRRNNAEFRKQLRKEQKRVKRAKVESAAAAASLSAVSEDDMHAAFERLRQEPMPSSNQDRETYFTTHVANGEQLSAQGPAYHLEAALAFYRALRVYPQPVELLMIYQKTVPEAIFNIIMKLTTLDVSSTAAPGAGRPTEIPITFEDDIDESTRSAPSETSSSVDWEKLVDTGTNSPTGTSSGVHIS